MGILEIIFLVSTAIPSLHASTQNSCSSSCGSLCLSYPFKLQNTQPQDNRTYVDLKCIATLHNGTAILSLPDAGDFYVLDIDFEYHVIDLYDPGNCTMKKLMNTNLSIPAPLQAITSQNYTFYTCPVQLNLNYHPIHCLSNSTNVTITTASLPFQEELNATGVCEEIGTWLLPELVFNEYEHGAEDLAHLYFTWGPWGGFSLAFRPQYNPTDGLTKDNSSANYDPSPYMSALIAILYTMFIAIIGGF